VTIKQTPDGAWRDLEAMGLPDVVSQIGECDVGVISQGHALISMRCKAMRAIVGRLSAASCARSKAAGISLLVNTLDRGRRRNAEKLRSRPSRHPAFYSRYKPLS